MALFTNWKLIRIKHSPAKLALNTNLNMIQFHLENKSKIKWFLKKYPHKRWLKPNTDKYIHKKQETWANLEKKIFFFLFGGLLWPRLNPPIYSFQGKKIVFSDHRWTETLTELSCSPSPMSSVFSGRGIWGGFPAKWLQLFPRHLSDGVSAHVDFG